MNPHQLRWSSAFLGTQTNLHGFHPAPVLQDSDRPAARLRWTPGRTILLLRFACM